MPRSTDSRLASIETTVNRAEQDRVELNRKIDNLDAKFDAMLATNGGLEGSVRQLAQSVDSSARAITKLCDDNCGLRLTGIEKWMPQIETRLGNLEQPRELRLIDEKRLADVELGVKDYRASRHRLWQLALAFCGSGAIADALFHLFGKG